MLLRIGIGALGIVLTIVSLFVLKLVIRGSALTGRTQPVVASTVGHFPTMVIAGALVPFAIPLTLLAIGGTCVWNAATDRGFVREIEDGSELAVLFDPTGQDYESFKSGLGPHSSALNFNNLVVARPGSVARSCPKNSCAAIVTFGSSGPRTLIVDDYDENGRLITIDKAQKDGYLRFRTANFGSLWIKTDEVAKQGAAEVDIQTARAIESPSVPVFLKPQTKAYSCPRTNCSVLTTMLDGPSSGRRVIVADSDVSGAPDWVQVIYMGRPSFVLRSSVEHTHSAAIKVGGGRWSYPGPHANLHDQVKASEDRSCTMSDSDVNIPNAPDWVLCDGWAVKKSDLEPGYK